MALVDPTLRALYDLKVSFKLLSAGIIAKFNACCFQDFRPM